MSVLRSTFRLHSSVLHIRTFVTRPHPTVDRIIRVDHAGEYGADRIYAGQMAVLGNSPIGPVVKACLLNLQY